LILRTFIIYSPTAWSSLDFNPKNLPGYGRLDVIFRTVLSAFKKHQGFRDDVKVVSIHEGPPDPPLVLTFIKDFIKKYKPYNEVELARNVLQHIDELKPSKHSMMKVIDDFIKEGYHVFYLKESGENIDEALKKLKNSERLCFILGSQVDIPANVESKILSFGIDVVSIGPKSYLSSQVVTIVNYVVDRFYDNL